MTIAFFSDVHGNLPALLAVLADANVLLFGHPHKPYHWTFASEVAGETCYRHALNIGSMGKPKDGDPRVAYQLLRLDGHTTLTDPASVRSELVRVSYGVEKTALAVEASPLPNEYADMLRKAYQRFPISP